MNISRSAHGVLECCGLTPGLLSSVLFYCIQRHLTANSAILETANMPPSPSPWTLDKRTNSVNVNPPYPADSHLTNNGSSWLWAVFAVHCLIFLAITAWTFFVPKGRRAFHHLAIVSAAFPVFIICFHRRRSSPTSKPC